MPNKSDMKLAVKSAPCEAIFSDIEKADIKNVELYLNTAMLGDVDGIIRLCRSFPFEYAMHAPDDGYDPEKLLTLSEGLRAKIMVLHTIYWEDEWARFRDIFKDSDTLICIENLSGIHEPLRIIRRYGFARCLDLEHMQLAASGIYEDIFVQTLAKASHVHITGYKYGSDLWHTHVHHSPEHGRYLLGLLLRAGYKGFVVSEAEKTLQTYDEFKKLKDFYDSWSEET